MAGVELEQYATGNEMSNQQSEKQSFPIIPLAMECQVNDEKRQIFPKTRQTWFFLGKRVATYNFAALLLCTAQSLFRLILDCGSR